MSMMRKLMLIFLSICFLFGMTARVEGDAAKDFDLTGDWTQDEIEYFQNKEYVGDTERYTVYKIDYFPPYLKGKIKEELKKYGKIGKDDLKKIIREGKVSKVELLRYYNLLRKEIYAHKGYIFTDSNLEEFFGKMDWYQSKQEEVTLTGREKKNLKVINELEEIVRNTKVVSELFTKEVIIKAKWGKGPGEFELEPLPESYEYRPSFTMDVDGNAFIEDPNNQRINVFDKLGRFTKSIPIPAQLIYTYKENKSCLVEGVGVDNDGNIYFASSSTTELLTSDLSGEVVFKIDEKGKVLDSLTLIGYYVYPAIFIESDSIMYLWGSWEMQITAGVPLEFKKEWEVTELSFAQLRSNSFDKHKKSLNLGAKKMKINYDKTPVVFNESKDSRVVFYAGGGFVFQNSNGEIKARVSSNSEYFRYYPLGYGIPYKGHYVIISVCPYIDEDLNIYCIDGTDTHLHVIKYTPTDEVWK